MLQRWPPRLLVIAHTGDVSDVAGGAASQVDIAGVVGRQRAAWLSVMQAPSPGENSEGVWIVADGGVEVGGSFEKVEARHECSK